MADERPLSRRRRALESAVLSYAAVAFTVVQGILLVPLYLRHMSVELYGAWLATGSILGWLELADPGVSSILQQRVAFRSSGAAALPLGPTVGTGLAIAACSALVPLLAIPLGEPLAALVGLAHGLRSALGTSFTLGLVAVGLGILNNALAAVAVGLQEVRPVGLIGLAGLVAGVGVTVAGLLTGLGLEALPLGALARSATGCAGNLLVVRGLLRRRGVRLAVTRLDLDELLGEATYTFVSRVGVAVLGRLDALLSATLLSPTATVVLTLTGRVVDVVRLVSDRIGAATMPILAQLAGEQGADRTRSAQRTVGTYTVLVLGVLGGAAVAWDRHLVTLWVGPDKFGGVALAGLQALYGCLASQLSTAAQGVFALGGIRAISVLGLVEALVRLGLQLLLVRWLGLHGFPVAALLALALTSLPLLARAMAKHGGGTAAGHLWSVLRAWGVVAGFLAAGLAVDRAAGWPPSWPGLAAGGVATVLVLVAGALAALPEVRRDARRLLAARGVA